MKNRILLPFGFAALILTGAVLLAMPVANTSGHWMDFADAMFTSCSAVCITGLSVIDPGEALTRCGQMILMVLTQIGCVGIMMLGTFVFALVGRRMSIADSRTVGVEYGIIDRGGLRHLALWVVFSMLAIEAMGAWGLWRTLPEAFGTGSERAFQAVFLSMMSFSNAGFSIMPGSVEALHAAPVATLVSCALIITGGLGFLVLHNLCTIRFWRRNLNKRGRMNLHTRVVLRMTCYLTAMAFVLFIMFELGDGGVLARFDTWGGKLSVALFHSVTPRTAGLAIVPVEDLHPATQFVDMVLMFIGGGTGSAGGGIKMTTFFVFVCSLAAIYHGRKDVTVHKRTLPVDIVRESIVITFLYAAAIAVCATLLLATENGRAGLSPGRIIFETVSAITTTGLSVGDTTRNLSGAGRTIICLAMFAGRMGALTIVLLIAGREETASIRYPKEEIAVG